MPAEFPIQYLDPTDLLDHPANWGTHSDTQKESLAASMGEWGWLKPLIVNTRTMRIVDGHARAAHARALGVDQVPCRVVDVDEETEERMLATVDRVGELRGRDEAALLSLLSKHLGDGKKPLPGWNTVDLEQLSTSLSPAASAPDTLDLSFVGGEDEDELELPEEDPGMTPVESHVRMVQLFLDGTTHPEFTALCDRMSPLFATENLTETVLEALRYADHHLSCEADERGDRNPRRHAA